MNARPAGAIGDSTARRVARLASSASIELNCLEVRDLVAGRELLRPGQRIFLSHLPRQTWAQTLDACSQVAAAGCAPLPHLPVRLLRDERELDGLLRAFREAGAHELLLISGDYPASRGPYAEVLPVLRSGCLQSHGFTRVSLAGHPEGHPVVPADAIWRAQIEKAVLAADLGLQVSLVTQFFFEATPFIEWSRNLRAAGVAARLVAGLAGPASIAKLLALARHCGVGPSIRALGSRPGTALRLLGDRRPDALLHSLAAAAWSESCRLDGIHLFCFGGFLRTARWLRQLADGTGREMP